MTLRTFALAVFALTTGAFGAACGGNVETSANGGHATTTTTTATGGHTAAGDCATDADCGGNKCAEVTPGGYKICLDVTLEASGCMPGGPVPDECCATADCKNGGKCFSTEDVPYCGGAYPVPHNVCATDACQSDGDCSAASQVPSICTPAGAFGSPMRTCIPATCHTDADCTAAPGGVCKPIGNVCCSTPQAIACVYPGGCAGPNDCSMDTHCEVGKTGAATCVSGMWGCPA